MADYDYGPLRTYEIIWRTGHIETVQGHSVLFDSAGLISLFPEQAPRLPAKFRIYGMFPGDHWRLVISAPEEDLLSIRDVTDREVARG